MTKRVTGKSLFWVLIVSLLITHTSCVYIYREDKIETSINSTLVESPVKAHLKNGATALFRDGALFTPTQVIGDGVLYSIDLEYGSSISVLERDEVAAYEVFSNEIDYGRSVGTSVATSLVATALTPLLLVAIFGSCPTIYSETGSGEVLEAELFSNSIAPILEARDVTSLKVQSINNLVQLEVRNEALETHYINHLELMEVFHEPGREIVPTNYGIPLSTGNHLDPVYAFNSLGEEVTEFVSLKDGVSYEYEIATDIEELQWDHIDLTFPPTNTESGALTLRLRNSLYTTILLYDFLLADQGINALDWIGKDLGTVTEAVALGDLLYTYMGIRVEQFNGSEYEEIGRISNTGPIEWKDITMPIETVANDSVKFRLKFLADSWRIDQIKFATEVSEPEVNYLPVSQIYDGKGANDEDSRNLLAQDDEVYFVTYPGEHFNLSFQTNEVPERMEASYLLAGQGFYIEWIRNSWVEGKESPASLIYSSDLMAKAQQKWQTEKKEFEKQFFNSKIPVE